MMERSYDEAELLEKFKDFDENYKVIQNNIAEAAIKSGRSPDDVHLLAATKTVPCELINYATAHGVQFIGENKAQELLSKYDRYQLPKENIHFIGHLQTNKVASIVGKVGMIQSVDSLKLAKEINKRSQALNLTTNILIEVNIGEEASKSGTMVNQLEELIGEVSQLPCVKIQGLMTIPPITDTPDEARKFFSNICNLSVDIRSKNIDNVNMDILSMGMSADYVEAILEGANMVRIGSLLFGKRIYVN